jgi:hypothetical protein
MPGSLVVVVNEDLATEDDGRQPVVTKLKKNQLNQ